MKSIFLRILRQLHNDKRSLGLIFFAPLLMLSLIYLLLGESDYKPTIAGIGLPAPIVQALQKGETELILLPASTDVDAALEDKAADAILTMGADGMHIRMLENENVKTGLVTKAVKDALSSLNPAASMEVTFVYGTSAATMFDSISYVMLGILSFFFVFLFSGVSFVRERTTETLERLMLTPVKRYEVIWGYTLGFGLLATVQSVIIVLFAHYVLGVDFTGSVVSAIATMILLAFTAVSLGSFFSIFANNEFQLLQFIPIVIVPQIFFSGLIPLDTIPLGLGNLCYIMPVYYGCQGLKDIVLKGASFPEVYPYLLVLLGFTLLFAFVNTLALKKYRHL